MDPTQQATPSHRPLRSLVLSSSPCISPPPAPRSSCFLPATFQQEQHQDGSSYDLRSPRHSRIRSFYWTGGPGTPGRAQPAGADLQLRTVPQRLHPDPRRRRSGVRRRPLRRVPVLRGLLLVPPVPQRLHAHFRRQHDHVRGLRVHHRVVLRGALLVVRVPRRLHPDQERRHQGVRRDRMHHRLLLRGVLLVLRLPGHPSRRGRRHDQVPQDRGMHHRAVLRALKERTSYTTLMTSLLAGLEDIAVPGTKTWGRCLHQ